MLGRTRAAVFVFGLIAVAACTPKPRPYVSKPLPRDAYAHYLRAKVALYEADYDLAVHELRAAAAAAPDEAMIAVALGSALAKARQPAAAAAVINAAQKRWPDEPEVWLGAGALFQIQNRLDVARAAYERAIRIDRRSERGYLGLASTWIAMRRPADAERTWRALLDHVPKSIEGRYRLAAHLLGRGDHRAAEPHLREVIELDPDHLDGRLDLAHALRAAGKLRPAIAETRQAFDRSGQDIEVGEELFWLLCEADDRTAALDLLGLLDDDHADLETRTTLVRLYLIVDETAAARAVAEAAIAASPSRAEAAIAAASARRATGDLDGAVAAVLGVPEAARGFTAARALAAEIELDRGRHDEAIAIATTARARHPRDVGLAAVEAAAHVARGDDAAGRAIVDELARRRPMAPDVAIAVATLHERAGRVATAIAALDDVLARRPNHVGALNLAGYLRADHGRELERAERDLKRARILAPGDPAILDSWGWLRFRRGDLAGAARALRHAVRLAPRHAELLFHLGEVLAAQGDRPGARRVLEHARGLSPTPPVRRKIDARLAALGTTVIP